MDDLREIKIECEEAIKSKKLPAIDPELRHVYAEILWGLIEVKRFVEPVDPTLDLLVEMGETRVVRRQPGPPRVKKWLNEA